MCKEVIFEMRFKSGRNISEAKDQVEGLEVGVGEVNTVRAKVEESTEFTESESGQNT